MVLMRDVQDLGGLVGQLVDLSKDALLAFVDVALTAGDLDTFSTQCRLSGQW